MIKKKDIKKNIYDGENSPSFFDICKSKITRFNAKIKFIFLGEQNRQIKREIRQIIIRRKKLK